MLDLTKALPFELVLEVVSYLDTGSIVPFLNAFPHLKKHAICAFFHRDMPYFFDIDGVHRPPNYLYKDIKNQCTSRPIRLVEQKGTNSSYEDTGIYGRTTFVFLLSSQYSSSVSFQGRAEKFEEYGSKWRIGLCTRFSVDGTYCENQLPGLVARHNPPQENLDYSTLVTLRLEDVPFLQDLQFPSMRELSLNYGPSCTTRPIIRHIDAPKITRFLIHFYRNLPKILGLAIGYNRDKVSRKRGKKYPVNEPLTFELADTRFIDCGHESSLDQASLSTLGASEITDCNLEFIENFTSLNWIGVPLSLLEGVPLGRIIRVYLRLTCPYYCQISDCLDLPSLSDVLIHATKSGCVIPHFKSPLVERLALHVTARGVDFSNIWRLGSEFVSLMMYFHPLVLRDVKPSAYSIDHQTWNSLMYPVLQRVLSISIVGAEMPFLTDAIGLTSRVLRVEYCDLYLRPLLTCKQVDEGRIRIDAIAITGEPFAGMYQTLIIAPILRYNEAKLPSDGALLDFPNVNFCITDFSKDGDYAPITSGSFFRKCTFGEIVLTMPKSYKLRKGALVRWELKRGRWEDEWSPIERLPTSVREAAGPWIGMHK